MVGDGLDCVRVWKWLRKAAHGWEWVYNEQEWAKHEWQWAENEWEWDCTEWKQMGVSSK